MKRISLFLILIFASVNAGAVDYETAGSRWDWMYNYFETYGHTGYKQFITSFVVYDLKSEAQAASPGWAGPIYLPASYSCTGVANSAGFYFSTVTSTTPIQMQRHAVHMFDGCGTLDPDRDGINNDDCGKSIIDESDNRLGTNVEMVDQYGYDGQYGDTNFVLKFPVVPSGCLDLGLSDEYDSFKIIDSWVCADDSIVLFVQLKKPDGTIDNFQVGNCDDHGGYDYRLGASDVYPEWQDISQLEAWIQGGEVPNGQTSADDLIADVSDVFDLPIENSLPPVETSSIEDHTEEFTPVDDSTYTTDHDYYSGMIEVSNNLGSAVDTGFSSVVDGLQGLDDTLKEIKQAIQYQSGGDNSGIEARLDQLHSDLGSLSFSISGTFDADMSGVETRLDTISGLIGDGSPSFDFDSLSGAQADIEAAADTSSLYDGTDADIPDVYTPDVASYDDLDSAASELSGFFDNFLNFSVSASSSFSAQVFGQTVTFDFAPYSSVINMMGAALLSIAGLSAFFILFGSRG